MVLIGRCKAAQVLAAWIALTLFGLDIEIMMNWEVQNE
jgi:hypothetical protein